MLSLIQKLFGKEEREKRKITSQKEKEKKELAESKSKNPFLAKISCALEELGVSDLEKKVFNELDSCPWDLHVELRNRGVYFAYPVGEDNRIVLGKIKTNELRQKSSDVGTYSSQFIVFEPISSFNYSNPKLSWEREVAYNLIEFRKLAEQAWGEKQSGTIKNPLLEKFIKKRKNIKKEKFIEDFSLYLMNDNFKKLMNEKLDLNKKIVEKLKERIYFYYQFVRTGNRLGGYTES